MERRISGLPQQHDPLFWVLWPPLALKTCHIVSCRTVLYLCVCVCVCKTEFASFISFDSPWMGTMGRLTLTEREEKTNVLPHHPLLQLSFFGLDRPGFS